MNSLKKYLMMILLSACMMAFPSHAQENPDLKGTSCVPVKSIREDALAFAAGERMSFVIHYQWGAINTDVGYAEASLDTVTFNGQKAFRCVAAGKTTRFFDIFFKVREDFRSYFTCDGLRPLKFTRDTHEGGYEARNTYLYDWKAAEPHIDAVVYTSKAGEMSYEIPLTPCTFDLPALFYFARNMDFDAVEPGKRYQSLFCP